MERFVLKFLWLEKSIAIALDQKIGDKTTPLNEYLFWPGEDAWQLTKDYLENNNSDTKKCRQNTVNFTEKERIEILNQITEVINFWQERDNTKKLNKDEISKLKNNFPQAVFVGYD